MDFQDYYAVLGVQKNASQKDVRNAYRKLARKFHPDLNPGNKQAEERFKAINEAYEVLSDPEKRQKYDEVGSRWKEYEQWERATKAAGGTPRPEDFRWATTQSAPVGGQRTYRVRSQDDLRDLFGDESPFSDFFETFFGARGRTGPGTTARGSGGPRTGADLEYQMEVTLAEAYRGTTRQLTIQTPDGQSRRLEITIPAGVDTGSRVRASQQGMPGADGAPSGDLYLTIVVRPDPRYQRINTDLRHRTSAPFTVLVLGGDIRVPLPDGKALALVVPSGTQDGRLFRLRGKGMPRLGQPNQRGDLLVEVHALLPEQLTQHHRQLFEELARLQTGTAEGVGSR